MAAKTVKVVNNRPYPFIINYPDRKAMIVPAKVRAAGELSIPKEVFDFLVDQTSTFETGSLQLVSEEHIEELIDGEAYKNNSISDEEIEKMLKGNAKTIEKRLNEITDSFAKKTIVDYVQKHADNIPTSKAKVLSSWAGIDLDIIVE